MGRARVIPVRAGFQPPALPVPQPDQAGLGAHSSGLQLMPPALGVGPDLRFCGAV